MKKMIQSLLFVCAAFTPAPAGAAPQDAPEHIVKAFAQAGIPLQRERRRPAALLLKTLDGVEVSLEQLKGKVVFLNFWATWCPPCRAEMPSMEALYQKFRGGGLEVLACDVGENAGAVRQFIDKNNLSFPVLLDSSGSVSGHYGVQGIPATFIIDRGGMIILSTVGGRNWNSPAVQAAFEALLQNGN